MSESMAFIDPSNGNLTAPVNGHLTVRPQISGRSFYRPMASHGFDLEGLLRRIDVRLKKLGLSAAKASRDAASPDLIRNMQRALRTGDRQGVTVPKIASLAAVLETTMGWLLEGQGAETEDAKRRVPLVGFVGAGSEAHFYEGAQGPFDDVPAPDFATDATVAVEIRGESLGPLFDRWLAFYDDVRRPVTHDLLHHLCVIGLADGRVLIKKLQPSGRKGRFHLISQAESPILDAKVAWAARVTAILPR